jgi:hypothetical protein
MVPTEKNVWIAHKEQNVTTLKALFPSAAVRPPRSGPILPWKHRMLLALTLLPTPLQLLQTQWLENVWSKEAIYFLIRQQQGAAKDYISPANVDVSRPFISLSFNPATQNHCQQQIQPKVVLRELGILLLEIWREMTLETRFSLTEAITNCYDCQSRHQSGLTI